MTSIARNFLPLYSLEFMLGTMGSTKLYENALNECTLRALIMRAQLSFSARACWSIVRLEMFPKTACIFNGVVEYGGGIAVSKGMQMTMGRRWKEASDFVRKLSRFD